MILVSFQSEEACLNLFCGESFFCFAFVLFCFEKVVSLDKPVSVEIRSISKWGIPCQVVPANAMSDSDFENLWWIWRSIPVDVETAKKQFGGS